MINAKIIIKEIQYEETFQNLFPMTMKKCKSMKKPNLAIRFLLKMGDASVTAALGILNNMKQQNKNELLCGFVNLYRQEIQSALNALLQKDELGKNIQMGDIYMAQDNNGQLSLVICNIKVDYSSLMRNESVKQKIGDYANKAVKKTIFGAFDKIQKVTAEGIGFAAEIAAGAAQAVPNGVEKMVLSIMGKEENKRRLLKMAQQVLSEKGLRLKPEDFIFVQEISSESEEENIVESAENKEFSLSEELEEDLLDAVTGYLKDLLKEKENKYPLSEWNKNA